MKSAHTVTIRDVAREVGLHHSTVARALLNDPRLRESTIEEVRKAAKKLGYVRNPAFSMLGSRSASGRKDGTRMTLAVVRQAQADGKRYRGLNNFRTMQERATTLGYRIEEFWLDDYPSVAALTRVLRARGIPGAVLEFVRDPSILKPSQWSRIAVVARNIAGKSLPVHTIRVSHYFSGFRCLENIINLGYRHIGVAAGESIPPSAEDLARLGGFTSAMIAGGMDSDNISIQRFHNRSFDEMTAWVQNNRFDAVLLPSILAYRHPPLQSLLKERKLAVAVALLYQDDMVEGLAGMQNPNLEISSACIDRLDQLIRIGEFAFPARPSSLIIEPTWTNGKTLPLKIVKALF